MMDLILCRVLNNFSKVFGESQVFKEFFFLFSLMPNLPTDMQSSKTFVSTATNGTFPLCLGKGINPTVLFSAIGK